MISGLEMCRSCFARPARGATGNCGECAEDLAAIAIIVAAERARLASDPLRRASGIDVAGQFAREFPGGGL